MAAAKAEVSIPRVWCDLQPKFQRLTPKTLCISQQTYSIIGDATVELADLENGGLGVGILVVGRTKPEIWKLPVWRPPS